MILNLLRKIIYYTCFSILLLMALSTLYYIINDASVIGVTNIISTFCVLLFLGFISYIAIYLNSKKPKLFFVILAATSMLSIFIWNVYARTVQVSDYKVLLEGAYKIATGSFNEGFDKTSYFYIYNYQIGYAAYLALLMRFFGYNLFFIKFVELIYMTGAAILMYKIAKKLVGQRAASITSILYATFIFNILGSSVINNQHISAFLMLVGIYLILLDNTGWTLISGIIFGVMNVMRPVGIIIIIGVCIMFIYKIIREMTWRKYAARLAIFIFTFYATIWTFNAVFIQMNLTPSPISRSNIPYFKLVIGFGAKNGSIFENQTIDARKTNVYNDLHTLGFDYDKYNDECKRFLKQRIRNFKDTSLYLFKKMAFFLGEKDHQYTFALSQEMRSGSFIKILVNIGHLQYLFLILSAMAAVLFKIKRKSTELNIIYILLIGFIFVYLFIEAQTRYRYEAYIFICIFASEAVSYFIDNTKRLLLSKRNEISKSEKR
ncbi:dolichyl-phosphate-mannose-protein mannosyltransferase [Anaerobacterium chartisolvens]|uniref:Dolichyl-phosphate-mannose-protein mannosyltransferase n=2 Tax=Anaerobacterium chartisolvens TaxID=1297424 RepID=A0A369BE47_9FIRM|nr:dolichyl-phosphate-mannose-protein mannosyltransferase [Anaerobacterium chartisolvens]